MFFPFILLIVLINIGLGQYFNDQQAIPFVEETLATQPVRTDADDPAIWVHPIQPELSLIFGTDKTSRIGGLYSFSLDGKVIQHIENFDRPNNVDVEYGFQINKTYSIDLIVLTERFQKRLRIFSVDSVTRLLCEITGPNTHVFTNDTGKAADPMGLGLYKRMSDGKIYAIVSRKAGPKHGYLGQYELVWNGQSIDLKLIRYFGDFHGREIESIVIDDQLGFIYYSDEHYGIQKYHVDPTINRTEPIGFINTTGIWKGDSEGLTLYSTSDYDGYLITTDQIQNGSIFHIYERQGSNVYVKSIRTRADLTDGIDATGHYLNENFPRGLLVIMNSMEKNFLLYDWRNIEKELHYVKSNVHHNTLNIIYMVLELVFFLNFLLVTTT